MRSFLAIPVPKAVAEEASRQQAVLRGIEGARCLPGRYLQVTLDDLGDVPEESLEAVRVASERAAAKHRPFSVRVSGLCAFPDPSRPAVVGLNIHDARARLVDLRADIHAALDRYGFALDRRQFWPHVALARFGAGAPAVDANDFVFNTVSLKVNRITLFTEQPPEVAGAAWQPRWTVMLRGAAEETDTPATEADAVRDEIAAALDERLAAREPAKTTPRRAARRRRRND